jgi:hypothetical protein
MRPGASKEGQPMGKVKDEIEGAVETVVETVERLADDVRAKIATAIRECGIPLNETAINAVVDKIEAALGFGGEHGDSAE